MTTDSLTISSSSKSTRNQGQWLHYLALGLLANAVLWGAALLYLKVKKPTYTSTWAITVPSAGADANVNLPNIGQASYQNSSPYSILNQDPRQNYKFTAESEPVIAAAAAQLKMPPEKFGQPRIKIVDSSTIMEIEIKGASPEEAQNKSLALYKAIQSRLTELRTQEIAQRDTGTQVALNSAQKKLEIAQTRLSDYQARSGLTSNEQLSQLSSNIEDLRKQRAVVISQQQQANARLGQISSSLNLSSQQAAEAFALQTDQIFQQNLKDYSDASASLTVSLSQFTPEHPTVITQRAKRDAAQAALLSRSRSLLNRPVDQATVERLNLANTNSTTGRVKMFDDLVTSQADQRAIQAQAQALDQQIFQLENRLKGLAQQEATLDALKRDVQVNEAIFSSTATRLDLGKSNSLGSYPLIQMLAAPSLDKSPSSPKKEFVLLGTAFGSLLIDAGLVLLWLRYSRTQSRDRVSHLRPKNT